MDCKGNLRLSYYFFSKKRVKWAIIYMFFEEKFVNRIFFCIFALK